MTHNTDPGFLEVRVGKAIMEIGYDIISSIDDSVLLNVSINSAVFFAWQHFSIELFFRLALKIVVVPIACLWFLQRCVLCDVFAEKEIYQRWALGAFTRADEAIRLLKERTLLSVRHLTAISID